MLGSDDRLLALLHLCDSLFPTGSFAHSDGLEAATAAGAVSTAADLREWMDVCLDENLGRLEAPAVWLALRAWSTGRGEDLALLDAEIHALRPSSTSRAASRAIGARLLKTWQEIHPDADFSGSATRAGRSGTISGEWPEGTRPTYSFPVAFGIVCASIGLGPRASVEGFMYTRLAGIASSAMRLMAIGQRDAHRLLTATLARVPSTVDAIEARLERCEALSAFAPAFDIAVMGQQYVHSRLFLS